MRGKWAYPDTGEWAPERNTNEFIGKDPKPIVMPVAESPSSRSACRGQDGFPVPMDALTPAM